MYSRPYGNVRGLIVSGGRSRQRRRRDISQPGFACAPGGKRRERHEKEQTCQYREHRQKATGKGDEQSSNLWFARSNST
jgi:hypothetical protein